MKIIRTILHLFEHTFRPRSAEMRVRREYWADQYTKVILWHGHEAPDGALSYAHDLGLDVDALIAEHDRRKAASWSIRFDLDLANVKENDPQMCEKLRLAGIPDRCVPTHGRSIEVNVSGFYKRVDLPDASMSGIEIVERGVNAIHQRLAEVPQEFPTNRFPHGANDWKLESLGWNEGEQSFYLSGSWKAELRKRLPSKLRPESCIDLRRSPPMQKELISARPIPELEEITLSVWRWPDGSHVVMGISASEEASPPPYKPPQPEQPEVLRMTFPSNDMPPMEWNVDTLTRTPAMDFLFKRRCQQLGKPLDWFLTHTREALFEDYESALTATDLRASLRSGPTGPAPMPEGKAWPSCPHCGKPALFLQSVDVRDIGFADLLPGTTMVIFVCNDCYENGEWQNCSAVEWLGRTDEVVLVDRGEASPLVQRAQWYGAELGHRSDLPEEIESEMADFEGYSDIPCYPMPPCYGTKVGGIPAYLQQEEVFYDRDGIVMEYIAQIATSGHISAGGLGYVSFSAATGETYIDFQDT